jgi:dihydrofolate reductase
MKGSFADEMLALKQKTGDTLRCIGSISLVKSMIQLGLVDRLRLTIFPLILGTAGREPIFATYARTTLKLMDEGPRLQASFFSNTVQAAAQSECETLSISG